MDAICNISFPLVLAQEQCLIEQRKAVARLRLLSLVYLKVLNKHEISGRGLRIMNFSLLYLA